MAPPDGAVSDSNTTMGGTMPKYLVTARYSSEGARGVIKGGGGTGVPQGIAATPSYYPKEAALSRVCSRVLDRGYADFRERLFYSRLHRY